MVNCKSNNLTLKIGLVPILYQDNFPPPHKRNKGAFSYASIYLKLLSRPFFCLNFYLQVDHHHSCTWHLFDATNGRPWPSRFAQTSGLLSTQIRFENWSSDGCSQQSPASSIAILYLVKRITAKKTLFFWHQTKTGEKMCLGWTDSWKDVVSCLTESHGKLTSRHQGAFSARRVSAFQLKSPDFAKHVIIIV